MGSSQTRDKAPRKFFLLFRLRGCCKAPHKVSEDYLRDRKSPLFSHQQLVLILAPSLPGCVLLTTLHNLLKLNFLICVTIFIGVRTNEIFAKPLTESPAHRRCYLLFIWGISISHPKKNTHYFLYHWYGTYFYATNEMFCTVALWCLEFFNVRISLNILSSLKSRIMNKFLPLTSGAHKEVRIRHRPLFLWGKTYTQMHST